MGATHLEIGSLLAINNRTDGTSRWETTNPRGSGHTLGSIQVDHTTYASKHDARGRMTAGAGVRFVWGPRNRLVHANQSNNGGELYLYSAGGRMVARGPAGDMETYVWHDNQMIAGYDADGTLSWEATWGPSIDRLISWRDYSDGSPDLQVPLADERRSVAATWSADRMDVDQIARYDEHGRLELQDQAERTRCEETGKPGTVCDNPSGMPFGFVSAFRSNVTGMVYLRNRWYSPKMAQFISRDPMGYVDSYNPYAYVAMDPVNGWDPWGLENQDFASRAASGAVDGLEKQAKSAADNVSNCVMNPLDCAKETAEGLKEQARDLEETYKDEGTEGVVDSLIPMNEWQRDYRRALTRYSNGDPDGANEFGEVMSEGWQVSPGGIYRKSLFRPDRPLPRNKDGVSTPDTDVPHTQLGNRKGGNGEYRQSREWTKDEDGNLVKKKDIDWTDHGRPQEHANPHQHRWEENETGGSLKRGDGEPLDDE